MHVSILGCGGGRFGTALLAKSVGFEVFVSDSGQIKNEYKTILTENHIECEEGEHSINRISNSHFVIKSPGIPSNNLVIQTLKNSGVEIMDEVEFAAHFTNAKLIAITGTNGKSTVSNMVYHILHGITDNVEWCGNNDNSFAYSVYQHNLSKKPIEYYVLELSSAQLEYIKNVHFDVGCILNISSNHIDFHGCFDEYINSKINILKNLSSDNVLVYNSDDEEILKHITKAECKLDPVTLAEIQNFKYKLSVEGTHNIFNTIFAAHIVKHLGIDDDTITRALGIYQPLPHRIEFVDEINGVLYYDDSKSTTVASTIAALNSLGKNKNIILLAGGHDKGNDYSSLLPYKNIVKIICIGRDNQKLLNTFGGLCVEEIDMFKAVQLASQYAKDGDIVLLSTMCASYDVYNNFEERGNIFKEAVHWGKQHSEIL